jgi:hypothetical protein
VISVQKIDYGGWPNCYRLANREMELIVTTDVGPRVIRCGFIGGPNLFKEFADQLGKNREKSWQARGGHRLWIAPEVLRDTYAPDNTACHATVRGDVLTVTGPVERETRLEKQMTVKLAAKGTRVEVIHRIRNAGPKTRWLAPWTPTMMAPGGVGITGFPPRGGHPAVLTPTHPLALWAFSDLSDPRWIFTPKYVMLRHDPKVPAPQKLGHFNRDTFGAYLLGTELFLKRYRANPAKTYPDFGCSYETFANADFLELETLGPLVDLAPGASVRHVEHWSLHSGVEIPAWTDHDLDRALLPLLAK